MWSYMTHVSDSRQCGINGNGQTGIHAFFSPIRWALTSAGSTDSTASQQPTAVTRRVNVPFRMTDASTLQFDMGQLYLWMWTVKTGKSNLSKKRELNNEACIVNIAWILRPSKTCRGNWKKLHHLYIWTIKIFKCIDNALHCKPSSDNLCIIGEQNVQLEFPQIRRDINICVSSRSLHFKRYISSLTKFLSTFTCYAYT